MFLGFQRVEQPIALERLIEGAKDHWIGTRKQIEIGGLARNRTGIEGFAVLCVTIPPRGLAMPIRSTDART